jgi:hypothetical protein
MEGPESKPSSFTAATACLLSEISYSDHAQDSLKKYLPGWKIIWNHAPINSNYAFLVTDQTNYALVVRGSLMQFNRDAFDNWIYQDLNVVVQKDWPFTDNGGGAKISQGAYDGWQNLCALKDTVINKTLKEMVDSVVSDNTPLYITGHSLGGNLATVYASWLFTELKKSGKPRNNIHVMTFGAPAAGNQLFASDFNKKFPNSLRVENTNDIVTKFPVAESIGDMGSLYKPAPSAYEIEVGYKFLTVKLSTLFTTIKYALKALELTNGNSTFTQTNGLGKQITIPLSGKNNSNDIGSWFAEAAYQHSIVQYAAMIGAPVLK